MIDFVILVGMALAVGAGIWGATKNQGVYFRIGSVFTAGAACVGLSHFGWLPFFGGGHNVGTYFGCMMLTFGIAGWLLFRGASVARGNPPTGDEKR